MCIEILLHIQIKKITEKQDEERNEEEKKDKETPLILHGERSDAISYHL